jgi:hypothetical protein
MQTMGEKTEQSFFLYGGRDENVSCDEGYIMTCVAVEREPREPRELREQSEVTGGNTLDGEGGDVYIECTWTKIMTNSSIPNGDSGAIGVGVGVSVGVGGVSYFLPDNPGGVFFHAACSVSNRYIDDSDYKERTGTGTNATSHRYLALVINALF